MNKEDLVRGGKYSMKDNTVAGIAIQYTGCDSYGHNFCIWDDKSRKTWCRVRNNELWMISPYE